MPDYSKGKIYTIRNINDNNKIYVGSTIQPLSVRLGTHKKDSKKEERKNIKLYIEVNGDWSNWYIELYENYPCSCKNELCKREGEIIRLIGNLNKVINGRTYKEYYEDNKNELLEKQKKYYEDNKDVIKEKNKEKNKEYYNNNKAKAKEYYKEYYEKNKNKQVKENQ